MCDRRYLSSGAAARLLGVSRQTILNYARAGRLPCHRLPTRRGDLRFAADVLADFARREMGLDLDLDLDPPESRPQKQPQCKT